MLARCFAQLRQAASQANRWSRMSIANYTGLESLVWDSYEEGRPTGAYTGQAGSTRGDKQLGGRWSARSRTPIGSRRLQLLGIGCGGFLLQTRSQTIRRGALTGVNDRTRGVSDCGGGRGWTTAHTTLDGAPNALARNRLLGIPTLEAHSDGEGVRPPEVTYDRQRGTGHRTSVRRAASLPLDVARCRP